MIHCVSCKKGKYDTRLELECAVLARKGQGYSDARIARYTGVSTRTVGRILNLHGAKECTTKNSNS